MFFKPKEEEMKKCSLALALLLMTIFLSSMVYAGGMVTLKKRPSADDKPHPYNRGYKVVIRDAPTIHGKKIGNVYGYEVQWGGMRRGAFIRISSYGETGWVFAEYYIEDPEAEYEEFLAPVDYITIVSDSRVRMQPSIFGDGWVGIECKGVLIQVIGKKGYWLNVKENESRTYWIYEELVRQYIQK